MAIDLWVYGVIAKLVGRLVSLMFIPGNSDSTTDREKKKKSRDVVEIHSMKVLTNMEKL